MVAAGLIIKWKEDAMTETIRVLRLPNATNVFADLQNDNLNGYNGNPNRALKLYDLQSLFFAWGVGVAAAAAAFLGEIAVAYRGRREMTMDFTVFWAS